jgi:small-conductance mechanosensitive channel
MDLQQILQYELWRHPVSDWALALGYAAAVAVAILIARAVLVSRLGALSKKTSTMIDDLIVHVISKTRIFIMVIVGLGTGAQRLDLRDSVDTVVDSALGLAVLLQIGLWLHAAVTFWVENYGDKEKRDGSTVTVIKALGFVGKLILWSGVFLFALENVGIEVTALVAGLGVGGIAIALALQNILGDLFASLSIVVDKPFVIGDFIIVGDFLGVVEHIGLKTVRVRSLSGEQLVFSNNDLLTSRIRNYGRLFRRRVPFTIGVTYQTPRELIKKIPGMLKQAVEEQENTKFDRAHFKSYGAYSLDFETVYFIDSPDYNLYMDIQQAINLRIHEFFEEEGIEFAYPTQTIFVEREGVEEEETQPGG